MTAIEILDEINNRGDTAYRLSHRLAGGEQNGAYLIEQGAARLVLKWQSVEWKTQQLLGAFPAVIHAADGGWPVARWLAAGPLSGGGAFLIQEYVDGSPISDLDLPATRAIIASNALQAGLGLATADNDGDQITAVLNGESSWKAQVQDFTAAGRALVEHGDAVIKAVGDVVLPSDDVIHGDYSSGNMLLSADRSRVCFIDSETVKRGTRVRDLADLYRQTFVYPGPSPDVSALLRATAVEIAGAKVFATCAVAVTYNNLAWWVENRTPQEFDVACARLHGLFDEFHASGAWGGARTD